MWGSNFADVLLQDPILRAFTYVRKKFSTYPYDGLNLYGERTGSVSYLLVARRRNEPEP